MAIPPRFLDELRSRITLSDVIRKSVRLTRAGREFKGCCPFHNEKTPSFYVNDDKQFYHCFGCGAHGTVIDFAMRHDNLTFPEAVETLAALAGLQVPKSAPEDIERAKLEKSLYTMMEDAARWMEEQLRLPANRAAMDYMLERGLSEGILSSFRVGYAPDDRQAMRSYLASRGYTDAQMIEAALIRPASEGGREPYAFFRERVMFPVPDRRGRVVAFGGRALPDHLRAPTRGDYTPAKYMNSSDTPLFHKGRMLYGEPHARKAAADGMPVIVVEGYLDVIAAHRAGFKGAVAPLGTALTEDQISVLWKMIPQDSKVLVLCFDGDEAGRRAASRACERILPMLKPSHSARIAFLPEGEDPDTLVRAKGAQAFEAVLGAALNLVDFLWQDLTAGKSLDTPEERAGLVKSLEDTANRIADRTVQHYYKEAFRDKVRQNLSSSGGGGGGGKPYGGGSGQYGRPGGRGGQWQNGRFQPSLPAIATLRRPVFGQNDLIPTALLASLMNNPSIFSHVEEEAAQLNFSENNLDQLRQRVLSVLSTAPDLDAGGLLSHVKGQGFDEALERVLSEKIYVHAAFARPSDDEEAVLAGWREVWNRLEQQAALGDLEQAKTAFRENPSEENENRLLALLEMRGTGEG